MGKAEILCDELEKLINEESDLSLRILWKAKEIEDRGLFIEPYNGLHSLLVMRMKLSKGRAQRLRYSIKMVRRLPELADFLKRRDLHYGQLCTVGQTIRTMEVSNDRLRSLFMLLHNKTDRQTEQIVAQFFDIKLEQKIRQRVHADGTIEMTIFIPPALSVKIEGAQERVSHSLKSRDLTEFVEYCCDRILSKKRSAADLTPRRRRPIVEEVGHCQRRNKQTGEVCGSKWQLEEEHIIPLWAGGTDEPDNIEVLCDQHNRMKYRKEAHIRMH